VAHKLLRVQYVCVCVHVYVCIAKWIGHQPGNRKVPGSIPG